MTSIIGTFPNTIRNGDTEDATVVMALLAFIQAQVNSNACPKTTGGGILKGDGSGGTTGAIVGVDFLLPATVAASSGSALMGFIQSGTGAVPRTGQAKLRDIVNIKDFRDAGDPDDTISAQKTHDALVVAGGGIAYMTGALAISAALNWSGTGVDLMGANQLTSTITQATSGAKAINNTGSFNGFRNFCIAYSAGSPTAGSTAIYSSGSNTIISGVTVSNCYDGFEFTTGSAQKADNFQITNYVNTGVNAHAVNDVFCSKFIINAGNATNGSLGGIRLADKAEAVVFTDGDVLNGVYSLTVDATSYTAGNRPAYSNFTNVFFDSSTLGVSINNMVESEFVGCWFSGGRAGAGASGCTLAVADSVSFIASRFFNCGLSGCVVSATALRTEFIGCKFESNSVTAGSGVGHGLQIANNTSDFKIIGGKAHNGLGTGQQGYGIFVGTGCDHFVVAFVNVRGNATGGILDASSASADKTIIGNTGYRTTNTGQGTIASGTTTVVVNHGLDVTPRPQDIALTRGSSNQGSVDLTVTTITSTQFTINTAPAPTGSMIVNWMARCAGA